MPPLSPSQASRIYDCIGRAQDWQAFYEDRAVVRLLANAELERAESVFELGCGTGRVAERLLERLSPTGSYCGVDLSPVMVKLASTRLTSWPERAKVVLVDGSLPLPTADRSVDRFISTFVFDLLGGVSC